MSRTLSFLFSLLYLAFALIANADTTTTDSTKPAKADPKWNVSDFGVPYDTLAFTTSEGAWISVDIHPNGKLLVFDLLGDIYTMPIEGGKATCIASGPAYEIQPRFSPDGKHISFTSDRAGADNIWVTDIDGLNPVQITKEDFRLLNNATWHPSGNYIVARKHFTGYRSMGAGEMWMYKVPEGGVGIQLTTKKNDQQDAGEPIFSPDAKYLYWSEDMTAGPSFQYNKDPNGTIYMIRRLNLETGEITELINLNGGAVRPQISPDGKTMAFVRRVRERSVLSLYDISSGEVRHLWDGLDEDQQETWSIFGVHPGFDWTPDGRAIVITAKGKLWKVTIADGTVAPIPFSVDVSQKVAQVLRFPQEIGGPEFSVKVVRWPQTIGSSGDLLFQALGYLYRYSPSTGKRTRLTSQTDHYEFAPSVSLDGKSAACVTWNDTTGGRVKIIDLATKREQIVVSQPGHYVTAAFSPDKNWVVYHRGSGDGYRGRMWDEEPGIYVVDAKGLTPPRLITREGRNPRFSADGQRITLVSGEGEGSALISVNLLGSDRRVLAKSVRAGNYELSPDGNWLAFEELWQTYVVPFPRTATPLDLSPETRSLPQKRLSKDGGTYLNWSADSKTINWSLGPEYFSIDLATLYAPKPDSSKSDTTLTPKTVNLGWQEKADIPNSDVYFVGARIAPMHDLSIIENGVVHVKGNLITEVGTKDQIKVPAGAKVIDITGKLLMPGLVDIHAHTGSSNQDIYPQQQWSWLANLAFGVTTTHDPSNNTEMIFAESELQLQGKNLAPRVFSTGTILYGADGSFKTVINKYEDAVSAIKRTTAWGAFSVKSYNQPRREQRQMVIKAARELGVMVVPEGGSTLHYNMTHYLDGHTTVEHCVPVAPLYDPELQLMSKSQTGYTPTLIVAYGGIMGENYWYQHDNVWENERLAHFTPRSVLDPRSRRRPMAPESEYHHFAAAKTATDILRRGGIVELGAHGQLQGLGAHWELWMLQQGGMTNHEALRCATWMGAKAIGLDHKLGSIQPGMLADLIVIDGDPLTDIRQSENILYTMINGRLYDAKTLEQIEPIRKPLPVGPNLMGIRGSDINTSCLQHEH
ncbi:MAG: PD40 domain-containing protein [bacterium]|nr:PD40 domain-containing protein [bacterium]